MKSDDGIARALRARMRMRESCGRKYRYKVPLFLKNEGAASFDERAGSSSDNRAEVIHIAPCSNKRAACRQQCDVSAADNSAPRLCAPGIGCARFVDAFICMAHAPF